MKKIFITGSNDGLGFMAAERLIHSGHQVLVHARNRQKAKALSERLPEAMGAVWGDLSEIAEIRDLAIVVNQFGQFDSVIHNAGVGYQESYKKTPDGLPHVFAINSLAPYILTCLLAKPKRLIYTSSGLHEQGDVDLSDLLWKKNSWNGLQAYSDTKLQNILLGFAIARRWKDVYSNVVTPGWVATKMGGPNAPDDLDMAPQTQAWLAGSDDKEVLVTGQFFYHQKPKEYLHQADHTALQDRFIDICEGITGICLPA